MSECAEILDNFVGALRGQVEHPAVEGRQCHRTVVLLDQLVGEPLELRLAQPLRIVTVRVAGNVVGCEGFVVR